MCVRTRWRTATGRARRAASRGLAAWPLAFCSGGAGRGARWLVPVASYIVIESWSDAEVANLDHTKSKRQVLNRDTSHDVNIIWLGGSRRRGRVTRTAARAGSRTRSRRRTSRPAKAKHQNPKATQDVSLSLGSSWGERERAHPRISHPPLTRGFRFSKPHVVFNLLLCS